MEERHIIGKLLPLTAAILTLSLGTYPSFANADQNTPELTFIGTVGDYASGWIDSLFPIKNYTNAMIYSDVQFESSSSDADILSLGSGYRQSFAQKGVWGGYIFYDRARSAARAYYNIASLGTEYLTPTWQYRLNYYLPFGHTTHLVDQGWADQMGNYNFVQFSGHEEYDQYGYEYETLSYGADLTVSYRFQADPNWELAPSPYAYARKTQNALMGSQFKINYYTDNHIQVFAGDSYDNAYHNQVFVGVTVNIGGRDNSTNLSNLMRSPVYRNLDVNTTADGLAVGKHTNYTGTEEVEENNIYFITNENTNTGNQASDSAQDGTYENPYNDLDEINTTDDTNANFWVADTGTSYSSTETITLTDDQTLMGRSSNFTQAANGSSQPVLSLAQLELQGDNRVGDLAISSVNSSDTTQLITIDSGADVNLDDLVVTAENTNGDNLIGIYNEGVATIENSTITTTGNGNAMYGIRNTGGTITIDSSTIITNGNGPNTSLRSIQNDTDGNMTLTNNIVTANNNNGQTMGVISFSGNVTIDNSTITSNNSGNNFSYAIYNGSSGHINVSNSTLESNSNTGASYTVVNYGTANLNNNVITANGINNTFTIGVANFDGDITISNNTINVDGPQIAYGIYNNGDSALISNNIINITGSTIYGITDASGTADIEDNNEININ